MIKIDVKGDKPNTYNGFRNNISFFIQERTSSDKNFEFFYILAIEEIDEIIVKM